MGPLAERLHHPGQPARTFGRKHLRERRRTRHGHQPRETRRPHRPAPHRPARQRCEWLLLLLDRRRRGQSTHQSHRPATDSGYRHHDASAAAGGTARYRTLGDRHPGRTREYAPQRDRPAHHPDARNSLPDEYRTRTRGNLPADPRQAPVHRSHPMVARREL